MCVLALQILVHREAGLSAGLCRGGSGACEPTLQDLERKGLNRQEYKALGNKV
jgi:hypothetical protein